MQDIHRSTTTWLAGGKGRGSAAQPHHRSQRRRLTLEPLEGRALLSLTTWTVNSLGDTGTGTGTSGDLRYVITQADQTTGDNTINFSVTGTIALNSALPDLSNTTGPDGHRGTGGFEPDRGPQQRRGAPDFGIFTVDSSVTASLTGLTISDGVSENGGGGIDNAGTMTVTNSTIADNSTTGVYPGGGGGINNTGTMTVSNSTVDNNSATGQNYPLGDGGGIDNTGTMTVSNSTIDNNSAGWGDGGGIYNTGTLTVTNSTVDNNSTPQSTLGPDLSSFASGGGIDNERGVLTLVDSQVSGNTSRATGGGIQSSGTTTIVGCSITGNQAQANYFGGGGSTLGDGMGGGLYVDSGALQLTDSTIQGNSVSGSSYSFIDTSGGNAFGGGIYLTNATATITAATISDNGALGGGGAVSDNYTWNSAPAGGSAAGGGIYLADATATITAATISGNSVAGGQGGELYVLGPQSEAFFGGDGGDGYGAGVSADGSLVLVNDTIADNQALGGAGGVSPYGPIIAGSPPPGNYFFITDQITDGNGGASFGGGIAGGPVTIVNSSIVANSTSGGLGGGSGLLYYASVCCQLVGVYGVPDFLASASGGGVSASATLDNTLVALNTQGTGSGAPASDIAGSVSGVFNLIGTGGSGGLVNGTNGNQVGVADPGLDPRGLQNNGGPTQTIALLPGSPAIDAGSNALAIDPTTGLPLTTDQRGAGFPRIVGKAVDIGAYEFHAGTYVTVTTQPPTSVTAGSSFGLTVTAENSSGNVDTSFNGTVTVSLATNPGGGTLGGTLSVMAQSGVATFSNLTLNKTGTGYTLWVMATDLPSTAPSSVTSAIDVAPAAASQLVVTAQPPANLLVGSGFSLVVSAEDSFGNVNPNFSGSVAVALVSNPGAATLGGTTSVTAQNGVANFTGLTLNEPGFGYTLSATSSGLTTATTSAFNVTLPQLVVTAQPPASVLAGYGFGLTVTAEDSSGNVDTAFNGTVTVALMSNPGGGTLGGTLSVTAVNGVATFTGLTLNEPGIGYTLSVSSNGLTAATTSAIDVYLSSVYTVDLTSSSGTGSGTAGDLVYAIGLANANTNPFGSEIEFDPTVFGSRRQSL